MNKVVNWGRWNRESVWHLDEAAALLLGMELRDIMLLDGRILDGRDLFLWRRYEDILDTARGSEGRDLLVVTHTCGSYGGDFNYAEVYPTVFATWAEAKGCRLPQEFPRPSSLDENETSGTEFLPIKEAVNLLLGLPEGEPMHGNHPGRALWDKAICARQAWDVNTHVREDESPTGQTIFVHMRSFMQWAQSNRTALSDDVKLRTPEALTAECARLENARNRPNCPLDEQDKAKKRIQWAEALLRRFAAVGVEAQINKTKTNEDGGDGRRNKQINALLEIIKQENMNPLAIPDGGKSKLKRLCVAQHQKLFTESGFNHAWKEAKKRGLIELKNPEQYR